MRVPSVSLSILGANASPSPHPPGISPAVVIRIRCEPNARRYAHSRTATLERVADLVAPQMVAMSVEPHRYCYPTDTTEEEWAFAAPYLTLLPDDAGQRRYALRTSYDALRWI